MKSNTPLIFVFKSRKNDPDTLHKQHSVVTRHIAAVVHGRRRRLNSKYAALNRPLAPYKTIKSEGSQNYCGNRCEAKPATTGVDSHDTLENHRAIYLSLEQNQHAGQADSCLQHRDSHECHPGAVRRKDTYAIQPSTIPGSNSFSSICAYESSPFYSRTTTPGILCDQYLLITSLDPFFTLPVSISGHERSLIHLYLSVIPTLMCGTSVNALYCPMRRLGPLGVQAYEIGLKWALITAGQYIDMAHNRPWCSKVFKWRAEGYQALNQLISDPHTDLDQLFVALLFAKLADHMLGDPSLNKMHLKGLDVLVQARGGLQSFASSTDAFVLPQYIMVQYAFVEFEIPTLSEAEIIKSRVLQNLKALQIWAQSSEKPPCHDYACQEDCWKTKNTNRPLLVALLRAKADILSLADAIGFVYEKEGLYPQNAGRFLFLHQLLSTLASFGTRYSESTYFLCRLKSIMERSSPGLPVPFKSHFGPMAVTQMISFARFEVYAQHFQGQAMQTEIQLCAAGIDAMKHFSILDAQCRDTLVTKMRTWLWLSAAAV